MFTGICCLIIRILDSAVRQTQRSWWTIPSPLWDPFRWEKVFSLTMGPRRASSVRGVILRFVRCDIPSKTAPPPVRFPQNPGSTKFSRFVNSGQSAVVQEHMSKNHWIQRFCGWQYSLCRNCVCLRLCTIFILDN